VPFEQSDEQLTGLLGDTVADTIAFGHIHFPYVRDFNDQKLANINPVSNPMDGDTRAKYGLLSWEQGSGWNVELVCVEYDVRYEHDELKSHKPPRWENLSDMLDAKLYLG
jgi:predicted phosphodiesterase